MIIDESVFFHLTEFPPIRRCGRQDKKICHLLPIKGQYKGRLPLIPRQIRQVEHDFLPCGALGQVAHLFCKESILLSHEPKRLPVNCASAGVKRWPPWRTLAT